MRLFPLKPAPKVKSNKLVQCFIPHGDTSVQEVFCHLIEFTDGKREVINYYGGIYHLDWDVDFSIKARVNAWKCGGKIAKDALINLSKLDRKIEKLAMMEAQNA